MLVISVILIVDAAMILADYRWFMQWRYGRRMILGDWQPAPPRSEMYAVTTAWRR